MDSKKQFNEKISTPCKMCDNAFVNPELSPDNDLSYITVGNSEKHMRIMMQSGDRRPTQIIFERYLEKTGWGLVGYYIPNFCPNCGRELTENRNGSRER